MMLLAAGHLVDGIAETAQKKIALSARFWKELFCNSQFNV
jgi:hypothetical protein